MSLYDELGGAPAIETALEIFYQRVMHDPRVAVFFEGVDVDRIKAKQASFLAIAFGGESEYDGRDLATAHARAVRQGLDDERFDIFVGHFRGTLEELGVPESKIEEVLEIPYGKREEVLGREPSPRGVVAG